jgi:hypothetical protein
VTARLIVMTVAIAFIYSLISSGRAPDGRDVAGIQQIKEVFEGISDAMRRM